MIIYVLVDKKGELFYKTVETDSASDEMVGLCFTSESQAQGFLDKLLHCYARDIQIVPFHWETIGAKK